MQNVIIKPQQETYQLAPNAKACDFKPAATSVIWTWFELDKMRQLSLFVYFSNDRGKLYLM